MSTRRAKLTSSTALNGAAKAEKPAASASKAPAPAEGQATPLAALERLRKGEAITDEAWEAAIMAETATSLGAKLREEAVKRVAAEQNVVALAQQLGAAQSRQAALAMSVGAMLPVLDALQQAEAKGLQVSIDAVQLRVLITHGRLALAGANPVVLGQRQPAAGNGKQT